MKIKESWIVGNAPKHPHIDMQKSLEGFHLKTKDKSALQRKMEEKMLEIVKTRPAQNSN